MHHSRVRAGRVGGIARTGLRARVAATFAGLLGSLPALAAYEGSLNMPVGVTPISRSVYSLHMLIFWVCCAIAVVVFGAMIYSIWKFRHSQGAVPDKSLTHSTKVEVVWTVIPVLILISMAVPAARTLVAMEDTRDAELTVKVTGYQWMWHYEYLGEDIAFFSRLAEPSNAARQQRSGIDVRTVDNYLLEVDQAMVVPVDTKVRVLITANDVIHSWWVPQFSVKKDAIPGFVNESWFLAERTGVFRGQCTELCGRDHAFMPIEVHVLSKEDFANWIAERRAAAQQAASPAPAAATASLASPAAAAAAL